MSDELESLRRVRETVPPPDPAIRNRARAPWDEGVTEPVIVRSRRGSAFGWRVSIAAVAVAALAVGAAVVARQRIDSVSPSHFVSVTSLPPVSAGDPAVFLFVGSDSRAFVQTDAEQGQFGDPNVITGSRADTIMLVRVDPVAGKVLVVSVPRDLFVTIPGCGLQRFNASFSTDLDCGGQRGGTQLLVDTIRTEFGVPINHVIQTDFTQFAALVDEVGGLQIRFAAPSRDTKTGLSQPAGCNTLHGEQALAFVRSRYFEWFDGDWRIDPTSDLGRQRRQQYALQALAAAAQARAGTDPRAMLRALFAHITVDPDFTADDALRFARAFAGAPVAATLTVPTRGVIVGGNDALELAPEAHAVFDAVANGTAVPAGAAPGAGPAQFGLC